jgi:hypothetical protein
MTIPAELAQDDDLVVEGIEEIERTNTLTKWK